MPVLRFNYTAPQLVILPKDGGGKVETRAAVGVALEAVVEVASSRDSTTLASAFCVNGTWNATDESNVIAGASQSFTYSCLLVSDDDSTASDAVTMEMQFDLFDTTTNVALHDLVNLTMTPSLTKFSLRMRGRWPWRSSESRLQLRMAINPTFSRAVLVETVNGATASSNGSSSAPLSKRTAEETVTRATTWRLEGQKAAEGLKRSVATLVRLVNVVDLDGETRVGDEWISFALQPPTMNKSSSEMVVSFGQFNESLSYDPDLGVILGRGGKSDESGGDDNTAVIIGVSVAVPLAILVVVIVVAAGAAMFWFRRDNAVRYHYDHQL